MGAEFSLLFSFVVTCLEAFPCRCTCLCIFAGMPSTPGLTLQTTSDAGLALSPRNCSSMPLSYSVWSRLQVFVLDKLHSPSSFPPFRFLNRCLPSSSAFALTRNWLLYWVGSSICGGLAIAANSNSVIHAKEKEVAQAISCYLFLQCPAALNSSNVREPASFTLSNEGFAPCRNCSQRYFFCNGWSLCLGQSLLFKPIPFESATTALNPHKPGY